MEINLLLPFIMASLFIAVFADSPVNEHIFVFQKEELTIDCTGRATDPILMYRKTPTDDPTSIFIGTVARAPAAAAITPRAEGTNVFYDIKEAAPEQGGEYECDWSAANDETNHYVNVVDKDSIVCPTFSGPVEEDVAVSDLTACKITSAGALIKEWMNNKTEHVGLDFNILNAKGDAVAVDYDEEAGVMSASAQSLTFKRADNGTKLTCKFVSQHGTEAVCESEPINVKWSATGLQVDVPEKAEKGAGFEAACSFADAGNPVMDAPAPMIDGAEGSKWPVNADDAPSAEVDGLPAVSVTCKSGEMNKTAHVLIHAGPTSVGKSVEEIVVLEGEEIPVVCNDNKTSFPAPKITYTVGEEVIAVNAGNGAEDQPVVAKAEWNGKKLVCTVTNVVSGASLAAEFPSIIVKFAPKSVVGTNYVELPKDAGASTSLDCKMNASPDNVTYSWTHNGTAIDMDAETIDADDFGTYVCTATNEVGSTTLSFELTETQKDDDYRNAGFSTAVSVFLLVSAWISSSLLLE